ncbi:MULTISPECIES: transglycosylase domain-containing protein [Romboutsia]|uniref:Penicillin-binding protein 1A n=1 Tax=Romboutsia hominis TaxID=1507512 RepID=A0A2P2BUC2_9FIRM|nr:MULTISPECIES: transglycosylase domain-containing protein [Romboutsia]CEI73966.1 Penicillin-binding protein 1A [Romboutsia hominis]
MNNDNNENRNKIRRKKASSSSSTATRNSSTTRSSSTSRGSSTSSSNKKTKPKKKKDKFKTLRSILVVCLVLLVAGVAVGTGVVFASLRNAEPISKALLEEKTYQTTRIYYANNDLLSNAPSVNKKQPVPLKDMGKYLPKAIVAIEDERFYEHGGVDIRGLLRSVVKTLTGDKQGGSTIPMQVSKMLLTSTEQSLPRKIKDIYYAHEMSKVLSKDEILELYLNNFFVGKGLAGAEAGARGYFDKKASQLTLGESALLAGSTQNPSRYSAYITAKLEGNETKDDVANRLLFFINTPDDTLDDPTPMELDMVEKLNSWGLIPNDDTYKQLKAGTMVVRKAVPNPKAKERRNIVLGKMLQTGAITQSEYNEAVAEEINIKLPKPKESVSSSVEDLIEYKVIDALVAQGNTKDEAYNMFYNGGLKIHTTIDPKMQKILEKEYDNDNNFPGSRHSNGMTQPQSSMVILDYKTGEIKALVGGRHITGRKTLNRATTPQQPGSTIKPLSVYTPAIDTLKLTQATALSDTTANLTPYKFKENNKWNPNTTTPGKDIMSLRKALAYSSNTIAIRTAELLGDSYKDCVDIMMDYLKNFGITTLVDSNTANAESNDRRFPALTLGGMTHGISPLEMASAYGTLANGGVYIEPTIFTTITSYDGQLIVKNTPEQHKVVDPDVAYVITDMLKAVITEGIGGKAAIPGGMPVAGKTGTTNKALDAWFVGYTPYYVGATYIGDDAGRKNPTTGEFIPRESVEGGSGSAAKLWSIVMRQIHENLKKVDFKVPDKVYFAKINLIDGGRSSSGVKAAFIDGTSPTKYTSRANAVKPKHEESTTPPENQNNEGTVDNNTTPPADNGGGNTTPPTDNGGGNTTPPADNGGGNTTPPADNGGGNTTTPPPNNGGGTATPPPSNGGGNTTPPADNSGGATNPASNPTGQ